MASKLGRNNLLKTNAKSFEPEDEGTNLLLLLKAAQLFFFKTQLHRSKDTTATFAAPRIDPILYQAFENKVVQPSGTGVLLQKQLLKKY